MFGNSQERRYHESMQKAMEEHRQQRIADGQLSEERYVTCIFAPMDSVSVQRVGPAETPSTHISLRMTVQGRTVSVALTAARARVLAALLSDHADEIDPPEHSGVTAEEWQALANLAKAEGIEPAPVLPMPDEDDDA